MEYLLDELKSLLKEIEQVKQLLINPPKQQKILSLKVSLYQICILKERLQAKVYETKNENAIKIIKDSSWNNLKEYFDRNMKLLEEKDEDMYPIFQEEIPILLLPFEQSVHSLKEILTPKDIHIIYTEEYQSFIQDRKNASNRKMLEKLESNIKNYWLIGGEARGRDLGYGGH